MQFNTAVRDLEEMGFEVRLRGPWEVIKRNWKSDKDWMVVFYLSTWREQDWREVRGEKLKNLNIVKLQSALQQIQPSELRIESELLLNLDIIKGVRELRYLELRGCKGLQNINGLQKFTTLFGLTLIDCSGLKNIDGIKGLTKLKNVNLIGCRELENLDGLDGVTELYGLALWRCTGLQNVKGLKGLRELSPKTRALLDFPVCTGAPDYSVPSGHITLSFYGCTNLSKSEIESLRVSLPNSLSMGIDEGLK